MKKLIGSITALFVLLYLVWKIHTSFSTDLREEQTLLKAVPVLSHYADGLWILINARGKLSDEDSVGMLDPWGEQIRAEYKNKLLTLTSSGSDKEFETKDDIKVERKNK
ncbi:MAG TPA: hypothetical protein VE954_12680 [Oligoflexus sp.]|uniref:hypothetical protein n=1 Tax=Oligoflexus sp. TaxID=1971216 RepID=UPI002D451F77|nr:hypothetical protein [Oligoflexus sp.]HYX33963.1 hypothetical protein [Oligoflexus sp.]